MLQACAYCPQTADTKGLPAAGCAALQGTECKRMFKVLDLQPGDALKLSVSGRESGIPTCRATVIPAGARLALGAAIA